VNNKAVYSKKQVEFSAKNKLRNSKKSWALSAEKKKQEILIYAAGFRTKSWKDIEP
jgi:tRNA threonylcarbamoyladenosine modification (KEOPS) complex Cgi121 subunit